MVSTATHYRPIPAAQTVRVYLYGADRERLQPVPAAFAGGGCGAVACSGARK